jgi:replication-associated recombination protein RarA
MALVREINKKWPLALDGSEKIIERARKSLTDVRNALKVIEKVHRFVKPADEVLAHFKKYVVLLLATW